MTLKRKTRFILATLVSCAVLVGSAVTGHAQGTVDPALAETYNAGLSAAQAGNFELAKTQFEAALAIDPEYKDAHYNLALVLQRLNDNKGAATHFAKVLSVTPNDKNVLRLHAESLHRAAQYKSAVAAYDKAIAADVENVDLYYQASDAAAKAYTTEEETPKVVAAIERALEKGPDHKSYYSKVVSLGTICSRSGDYAGAIKAYKKASEMKPDDTTPIYNSAVVYQKQSKWNDAVASLKKVLELDADNSKAHYMLGGIYYNNLKNDQAALTHYEKAAADKKFNKRKTADKYATTIREYLEKKRKQKEEYESIGNP